MTFIDDSSLSTLNLSTTIASIKYKNRSCPYQDLILLYMTKLYGYDRMTMV